MKSSATARQNRHLNKTTVRHYDPQADDRTHGAHDRQEQLTAAAEALRSWVHEQRVMWETPLPDAVAPSARPSKPAHSEPAPSTSWRASLAVFSRLGEVEEPAAPPEPEPAVPVAVANPPDVSRPASVAKPPDLEVVAPAVRTETIRPGLLNLHTSASASIPEMIEEETGILDTVRESVERWKRPALALAVVALLGFGGWNLRAYWQSRPPGPAKLGTAVLESVPSGLELRVDGKAVGKTPFTTELKAGRHTVEFWRKNVSRRLEVDVKAGKTTVERLDWAAKRKGSLEVLSDPEGATVIVDGSPRGVTPLTLDDLSIGSHSVVLESAAGSLKRTVEIAPDRVAQVTEAIYSGWLHVSSPIELQVSERTKRLLLDDRSQILLPPGGHSLRFENSRFGFQETRSVEIKPGAITSISIAPAPSVLTINASLPAEVLVDGQRVGETPLVDSPLALGTHLITVRSITGAERRFTVTATAQPVHLDVDFSKP